MKKTYINPEMEVITLQTAQMLAASANQIGFDSSTEMGVSDPQFGHSDDFDW